MIQPHPLSETYLFEDTFRNPRELVVDLLRGRFLPNLQPPSCFGVLQPFQDLGSRIGGLGLAPVAPQRNVQLAVFFPDVLDIRRQNFAPYHINVVPGVSEITDFLLEDQPVSVGLGSVGRQERGIVGVADPDDFHAGAQRTKLDNLDLDLVALLEANVSDNWCVIIIIVIVIVVVGDHESFGDNGSCRVVAECQRSTCVERATT